jgi:hypothetical protein
MLSATELDVELGMSVDSIYRTYKKCSAEVFIQRHHEERLRLMSRRLNRRLVWWRAG